MATIVTSPKRGGCNLISIRNPVIYEIQPGSGSSGIDIQVVIGTTTVTSQRLYSNSGNVKVDIGRFIASWCERKNNFDFTGGNSDDSNKYGQATFKYKDISSGTYSIDTFYFCYGQHPIDYPNIASGNDYMMGLTKNITDSINIERYFWEDNIFLQSGFNILSINNNYISFSSSTTATLIIDSFSISSHAQYFRVNIIAYGTGSVKLQLLDGITLDVLAETNWLSAVGTYNIDISSIPTSKRSNIKMLLITDDGGAAISLYWWVVDQVMPTINYKENNDVKIYFAQKYDVNYSGSCTIYYKIPSSFNLIDSFIIIQELGSSITNTSKDLSGYSGSITFTKTANRHLRAFLIYVDSIQNISIINDNPFLTDFEELKYYKGLPMELAVCALGNNYLNVGSLYFEGTTTTSADIGSGIKHINLKNYIDENKTLYVKKSNSEKLSKDLFVKYIETFRDTAIYLCWMNTRGQYDYYLFDCLTYETTTDEKIDINLCTWGIGEKIFEQIDKKYKKKIDLGTGVLTKNELKAIETLIVSKYVWMLTNPNTWEFEGAKWLQVKIENPQVKHLRTSNVGVVEFSILIDNYFYREW